MAVSARVSTVPEDGTQCHRHGEKRMHFRSSLRAFLREARVCGLSCPPAPLPQCCSSRRSDWASVLRLVRCSRTQENMTALSGSVVFRGSLRKWTGRIGHSAGCFRMRCVQCRPACHLNNEVDGAWVIRRVTRAGGSSACPTRSDCVSCPAVGATIAGTPAAIASVPSLPGIRGSSLSDTASFVETGA